MRNNIITATVSDITGRITVAPAAYQWDYGIYLRVVGLDLPEVTEWHFSRGGEAMKVLGDSTGVMIPDEYLEVGGGLYAYLYMHTGLDDGETVYTFDIPVIQRPKPEDIEPTPEQQDIITQAIAAMQAAQSEFDAMATADGAEAGKALAAKTVDDGRVTEWEFTAGGGGGGTGDYSDLTNKPKINNVTLSGNKTAADLGLIQPSDITATKVGDTTTIYVHGVAIATVKDGTNGQDGEDGYSPSASVSKSGNAATISITDEDGTTTATVTDGQDGKDGTDGQDGQDGYSPTASVSKAGTTATITITDKNGTTTAQVKDGTNGQPGAPGQDGYSPSASVSKSGNTATISITDKTGTTMAQISDGTPGSPGSDGDDGITPDVIVTSITGGHNIAFDYGTGDSRNTDFDVMDGQDGQDGEDGHTPVKGTDYWTAQDQAAMVQDVVTAISPTMQTKAITDTGGYYTTDTVEGALQEIGAEIAGVNTLIGTGVIS